MKGTWGILGALAALLVGGAVLAQTAASYNYLVRPDSTCPTEGVACSEGPYITCIPSQEVWSCVSGLWKKRAPGRVTGKVGVAYPQLFWSTYGPGLIYSGLVHDTNGNGVVDAADTCFPLATGQPVDVGCDGPPPPGTMGYYNSSTLMYEEADNIFVGLDGGSLTIGDLTIDSSTHTIGIDTNADTVPDAFFGNNGGANSTLKLSDGVPRIIFGSTNSMHVLTCLPSYDYSLMFDLNDDDTYDTGDFCWTVGGYDADCDCVADVPAFVTRGIWLPSLSGESLWATTGTSDNWIKWDVYGGAAGTTPGGGIANNSTVDSDGDGTLDKPVQNVTAGFQGNGVDEQCHCTFPGGYSADPFDYTTGFCQCTNPDGSGAFYPITSDPNYGTLTSGPYGDVGTATKKWRSGYFANSLNVATITFNGIGYSNTYNSGANYFSSAGGQYWLTDNNYDNSAHRAYDWKVRTAAATDLTLMHLDRDATPQWWVDANGDGSYDLFADGTMTDCDNPTTSKVLWDISTGKLSCGTDQTGVGGGDEVSVDSSATTNPDFQDGGDINFTNTANVVTGDVKSGGVLLDELGNPSGNKSFTMANKTLVFTYTAPTGGDGAFEIEALGGFTGDLLHLHQHTGNPGAGTDLAHLESTDADVLPLRISGGGTRSIVADDPIEVTVASGTAPFVVASTTEVSNLRAATAGALATDPTGCTNQFVTDMAAAGALTCNSVTGGYVTDGSLLAADLSWDNTATRTAGQYVTVGSDTTKFLAVTRTETLTFTGATAVCNADPPLFKAPAALTITAIHCAVWAATSIPLSVEECSSTIGSCAGVDGATTITCDTDGAADDGALSNASIDSGDWIKLNFGSATGTITGATVTIYYTIP